MAFYRDLMQAAIAEGTSTPVIFIPLQRALVRIGVEAITESMGSLLKMQYKVNMNIQTLLCETQICNHGPNFGHAMPFLKKCYEVYKDKYCENGHGGSFVKHSDRQANRRVKLRKEPL